MSSFDWPDAVAVLGILLAVTVLVGGAIAAFVELRKTKTVAGHQDDPVSYTHLTLPTIYSV